MASIPAYESGHTVQFTWTSSVAPDAAPKFAVTDQDGSTVVCSITATQSNSTAYYALYTMPNSAPRYQVAKWTALKTVGSSAYAHVRRLTFKVSETGVP